MDPARANGREKWPVYRPYFANYLTRRSKIVNFMAFSDHSFGCYKLQFCTVQNAKSGTGFCKWQGNGGMRRLPLGGLTLELMRNFLPYALLFTFYLHFQLSPTFNFGSRLPTFYSRSACGF